MEVINYFESNIQEYWLEEIRKSEWQEGFFLYKLLSMGTFFKTAGEGAKVLLLTDDKELISFCTYEKINDIQSKEQTSWVGFVYTFPEYRGHHFAGLLFEKIEYLAKEDCVSEVYISTNYIGLYEKYGCEYKTQVKEMNGELSRIYVKGIG